MNKQIRNIMVTGATGAIGKAIGRNLAADPFNYVTIIARNEEKAIHTVREISQYTGYDNMDYLIADLAEKDHIFGLAEKWNKPLHILINNAATTPRTRQENKKGIELQFATNVLGYFFMIKAFTPFLKMDPPSRIINVASYWAGNLDLTDLEFRQRPYNNNTAYMQSKQANRMLTSAFAIKLKLMGISVNACHPGDVNSKLSNDLGFGGHESPNQGAATPVWLAATEEGINHSGKYFENKREITDPFTKDMVSVERLYEICEGYS